MGANRNDSAGTVAGRILCLAAVVTSVLVLLFLIFRSPPYLIYDEGIYLTGALVLIDGHGFLTLLLSPLSIPTGPLHAVLHAILAPVTDVEAPAVRWLNPVLLVVVWLATAYCIKAMDYAQPLLRSATIIGVPLMWASTGMALTELPAMAMACLAAAAMAWALVSPQQTSMRPWAGFVLAGLCLGLATLGRQLYLPGIVAFVLVAVAVPRVRTPALLAVVVTLATVAPVFLIWNGIVPPSTPEVSGSLSIGHGLLAIAYMAIIVALLAPAFYLQNWRWSLWPALAGGAIGFAVGDLGFEAALGVSQRLPRDLVPLFQRCATAALVGGGCALATALLANLWHRRFDRVFVLNAVLAAGYTLTTIGVAHQFSSRYLLTAFPALMLTLQPYFRPTVWLALRLLVGAALGAVLLKGYYDRSGPQALCQRGEIRTFCDAPALKPN